MSKPTRKRRPEILNPGLKQQTPHEKRTTAKAIADDKARWEYLFHPDRNVWKPSK